MKRRITYVTLAAGQPRAYADSITRVQVTFESQGIKGYNNPDEPFHPDPSFSDKYEERVREVLRALPIGFTDKKPENWADTRLDYLKVVGEGTWEFQTRSPFTD